MKKNKIMEEVKLPIKFKYNILGYKFSALFGGWLGGGNTKKEAIDSLISVLTDFTLYNWKYVEKPEPYLIIK